jgi:hypothetical protein
MSLLDDNLIENFDIRTLILNGLDFFFNLDLDKDGKWGFNYEAPSIPSINSLSRELATFRINTRKSDIKCKVLLDDDIPNTREVMIGCDYMMTNDIHRIKFKLFPAWYTVKNCKIGNYKILSMDYYTYSALGNYEDILLVKIDDIINKFITEKKYIH